MDPATIEIATKVGVPVVGAAGAFYRFWLRKYVRTAIDRRKLMLANIAKIPNVVAALEEVNAKLEDVSKELKTNGGRSLRDEVRLIATKSAINEQRIRALLQSHTAEAIFESNAAGEWVWANRTLINLTGRSTEEMYGNGWKNLVLPADRAAVVEEWRFSVRDNRECIVKFRLATRDGSGRMVTLTSMPWRSSGESNVIGYFGIIEPDRKES